MEDFEYARPVDLTKDRAIASAAREKLSSYKWNWIKAAPNLAVAVRADKDTPERRKEIIERYNQELCKMKIR